MGSGGSIITSARAEHKCNPRFATTGASWLQTNASTCVHRDACEIADPDRIGTRVTPEGGGGPDYKEL